MEIPPLSGSGTSNCLIGLKLTQLIVLSVRSKHTNFGILNNTRVIDEKPFYISWLPRSVKVLTAFCFCFELFVISLQLAFPVGRLHSLRVCWFYTHHTPAAACGLCCGELVGCEAQSMAAMLLCLKSKFFKVTEMFQIPFGSIQDLVSCK